MTKRKADAMSSEDEVKQQLADMGFAQDRIEAALKNAPEKTLEATIEWISNNEEGDGQNQGASETTEEETPLTANSMKCLDCGKIFGSHAQVEFHAAKTEHANFEESAEMPPKLSQEEVKKQMAYLQEKIREKRAAEAKVEEEERRQREIDRVREGKKAAETKRELEQQKIVRAAEEQRRQREADRQRMKELREQLERDKAERKARFASGGGNGAQPAAAAEAPKPAAPISQPKSDANVAKLQIRQTNGKALVHEFAATDTLQTVYDFITENRTDGDGNFKLMTTFPRKVYDEGDLEKSLKDEGLVPSAVIVMQRAA
eukprot:Clim_evm36s210 gene=Clim_evmTU36s210